MSKKKKKKIIYITVLRLKTTLSPITHHSPTTIHLPTNQIIIIIYKEIRKYSIGIYINGSGLQIK